MKKAHYRGRYHVLSRVVRERARADPRTRCWRCGKTLGEHGAHRNGRRAFWTAGHVIDGDPNSPLLPEASTCNLSAGGRLGRLVQTGGAAPTVNSERWF